MNPPASTLITNIKTEVGKDSTWRTLSGALSLHPCLAEAEKAGTPDSSLSWILKQFLEIARWLFLFLSCFKSISEYSRMTLYYQTNCYEWKYWWNQRKGARRDSPGSKVLVSKYEDLSSAPELTQKRQTLRVQVLGKQGWMHPWCSLTQQPGQSNKRDFASKREMLVAKEQHPGLTSDLRTHEHPHRDDEHMCSTHK